MEPPIAPTGPDVYPVPQNELGQPDAEPSGPPSLDEQYGSGSDGISPSTPPESFVPEGPMADPRWHSSP